MTNPSSGEKHRHIVLIANPKAGRYRANILDQIETELTAAGMTVDQHLSGRAGEIGEICAATHSSADVIVIAGGDGSLNDALRGLADAQSPPTLALIPFGTANVLAHELGLPFRAGQIIEMILGGRTAPLHHGLANGAPFVLMTSAGFDADVVHHTERDLKRRIGKIAYIWTALKRLSKHRREDLTVVADGNERITCRLAIITNTRCYGGRFVLCREASAKKPELFLVTFTSKGQWPMVRLGLALATNQISKLPGVAVRPVEVAEITSARPVACQVDGDPFGSTPVTVTAGESSLRIIVPEA